MNKRIFAILPAFFVLLISVSIFAQTQTGSIKIAFIDTAGFYDEKAGITKLVNANKQLNTEFSAKLKELQDGSTKLQTISKELESMQKLPQQQFNQTVFETKRDEGERLQRDLNYKKTEYETAYNKRRTELITPISEDIGKAIDDFAKKNGYGIILDIGKFADAGTVLYFTQAADSTKDFITFYNARPASAAAPK